MSKWYDRQGKLLTPSESLSNEWQEEMREVEKLLADPKYKVVKQDLTPGKKYWVSTVWLGLDHSWSPSTTPLIFETMVFSGRRNKWFVIGGRRRYVREDYEQDRYSTEEQAIKGHEKLLKQYSRKEKK